MLSYFSYGISLLIILDYMYGLPEKAKKRLYFWGGLLAISFLYCLYYLYFIFNLSREIPLKARHVIKFLFILIAYGIGVFSLKRNTAAWMMQIWHALYAIVLLMLLSLGIYDWAVARAPLQIRIIADDLQEFLVSPILYVGIGLIGKRLIR
jgi:heme A synthase